MYFYYGQSVSKSTYYTRVKIDPDHCDRVHPRDRYILEKAEQIKNKYKRKTSPAQVKSIHQVQNFTTDESEHRNDK